MELKMVNDQGLPVSTKWIRDSEHKCDECGKSLWRYYHDNQPTDQYRCTTHGNKINQSHSNN